MVTSENSHDVYGKWPEHLNEHKKKTTHTCTSINERDSQMQSSTGENWT